MCILIADFTPCPFWFFFCILSFLQSFIQL